ncbi:MAG: PAS domain S-box protein, partial [Desulfobacterales bacterium]
MSRKLTYEELEQRVKELENEAVEQKRVEKRLEEKEQILWALLNALPETAILVDLEGTILAINEVAAQRFGKHRDELIGKGMQDSMPYDLVVSREAQGDKVTRSGKPVRFQDERAGRIYDTNIYPVYDVEEKVTALVVYARDITETKRTEGALKESEERLKSFYDAAFEGIAITDQGRFLDTNRQFAEIFGYQRDELIGKEVMDLVAEEDREFVLGNIQSNFDRPYEHKALHKNGSIVFVEVQGQQIQFKGRPARVTAIHNLTDRIIAEEALRENEEKYRQLFDSVSDAIMLFDAKTRAFVDINDACLSVYGYSRDEFFKLKHSDITVEIEESNKSVQQILSGEISKIPLRYHQRKNGEIFPVEISGGTFKLGDRQIVCGVVRDITERKQIDAAIRQERDKAQDYLDIAGVILVALNPDQTIELINKKGCEILGYQEEEIIGKNWFDNFLPERMRDEVREIFGRLLNGEIEPIEYFENPVLTKSNKERMISWHNAVLRDDNGNIIGTLSSGEDVTEQRGAEVEKRKLASYIQQSQKMEAIGNLAGGIAHDFNNILTPLIIHTELALLDLSGDSPIRQN